ncbi:MAG: FMN-binding glutamate synthase family protein [Limnochordia bacterium]
MLIPSLGVLGGLAGLRYMSAQTVRSFLRRIMTDPYPENLAELYTATKRTGIQEIIETNLRAEFGRLIQRPFGSPKKYRHFDALMFGPAIVDRLALPSATPIDTAVVIGPRAKQPLKIDIPLLIAGMAYKRALSAEMKYALALGSTKAGTATNTGEGPILPKERQLAERLIVQYPRLPLHRSLAILEKADAIEIQLGQGATVGGAQADEPQTVETDLPRYDHPKDLPRLVRFLRDAGGGVPVGVKFPMTDKIEEHIKFCLRAGVDFLVLDGAQGATYGAPPILADDFGLPTFVGLCRATHYLANHNRTGRVSLIVSGGFTSPGQCLKAIALGADAVALGTMALYAASHTQTLKAIPWEPPTQVAFARSKYAKQFNWKKGAETLNRYLQSCTEEIKEGVRALGKHSLQEVSRRDLVALDEVTSQIAQVPLAYSKTKTRAGSPSWEK